MFGSLATAGTKALGGARFSLVNVLPGVLLAVVVVAVYRAGAYGSGPADVRGALPTSVVLTDLAAFAIVALVLGVLAQPFQIGLVQLLEGYGWSGWLPGVVVDMAVERHVRRRDAASDLRSAAEMVAKAGSTGAATLADAARRQRRVAEAERVGRRSDARVRRYPQDRDRVMPTMLGNVLRRGEDVAGGRYGLLSMTAYPRLYPYLSARLDGAMSRQLDLIATTSALCVTFAIATVATLPVLAHHPEWLVVPLATGLLSALSYAAALRAAAGHGALFAAAFDLHRFDMLRGLHYRLPAGPRAEFEFNEALSTFWQDDVPAAQSAMLKDRRYDHRSPQAATGAGGSTASNEGNSAG